MSKTEMTDEFTPLRNGTFTKILDELNDLLSQPLRAVLLGAGCSHCAGLPLMEELTGCVIKYLSDTDSSTAKVLQAVEDLFAGASRQNIEDFMSELVDLMAIAERREYREATSKMIQLGEEEYSHADLVKAYDSIKAAIRHSIISPTTDLKHHRTFVRTLHGSLQFGKSPSKSPVDYFTLNYDTIVEDALALEQVTYVDGFEGGATGWWNPNLFQSTVAKARIHKLHGGIDWRLFEGEVLPRRLRVPGEEDSVLIWPAATKYREAQRDPYAQLISNFRSCLRPQSNSDLVLAILGYSFGDSHINAEIEAGLRECRERVTCLIFTDDSQPTGIVEEWSKSPEYREQVHVYAKGGYFHGDTIHMSDVDLPWWRFEVLARLLGGER